MSASSGPPPPSGSPAADAAPFPGSVPGGGNSAPASGAGGLEAELLQNPAAFSYFQAIRVIRQALGEDGGSMSALVRRGLRIRADAELGFPGSDLVRAERLGGGSPPAAPGGARDGSALPWPDAGEGGADPGVLSGHAGPAAPGSGADRDSAPGRPGAAPEGGGPAGRPAGRPLPDILDGGAPGRGEFPEPVWRLTVTFMGLYGAASPLPNFYAQEVLRDERDDEFAVRELMDLISLSSYRSHALSYFYSLLSFRVLELKDPAARGILFSLMGEEFRQESRPDDFRDMGLFASGIRSAGGLLSLLRSAAPGTPLELEENVPRWVEIPLHQRGMLRASTGRLGESAVAGVRARDLAGKFRLRAEARSIAELEGLMPGGAVYGAVRAAAARYLDAPLVWDLEIRLPPGCARGVRLGERAGRLGLSAFLAPERSGRCQYVLNRDPEGAYV